MSPLKDLLKCLELSLFIRQKLMRSAQTLSVSPALFGVSLKSNAIKVHPDSLKGFTDVGD